MSDNTTDDFRGIVYIFDSLRYDYLGCNGYTESITPNIDRVAEDGMRCENAYAQAIWTYPSAASIFTGLYPESHQSQQFNQPLGESCPHLGEVFSNEDVTTACFSTTLGVSPERGFARGFDEFFHFGSGDAGLRPDIMDRLNDKLIPWIEKEADSGFFVVVWAMGTHHPYVTPEDVEDPSVPLKNVSNVKGSQDWMRRLPRDRVEDVQDRYESAVSYSDESFGEVIKLLERLDIYENTSLIVTSDHGEIFDEHARLEHAGSYRKQLFSKILGENRRRFYGVFEPSAFIGHQGIYPYDELIHVPLIIKTSSEGPEIPSTSGKLIELVDVLPTMLDLADEHPLPTIQGHSIFDSISGQGSRDYCFSASELHNGNLKYYSIYDGENKLCTKRLTEFEINDLSRMSFYQSLFGYFIDSTHVLLDETETRKESITHISEILSENLTRHIENCRNAEFPTDDRTISVSKETREHLSDLGYK